MKRVILWGTGNYGEEAYKKILDDLNYEIVAVCDNNDTKLDSDFHGYRIKKPIVAMSANDYDTVILCSQDWESMYLDAIEICSDGDRILIWNNIEIEKPENIYATKMYSQDGEELYLKSYFSSKKQEKGIYVDVGAYHPFRFSNTFWAYCQGWRGINIEPNEENYRLFNAIRPDDINLNIGISDREGTLRYYKFDEGAINTFDKKRAKLMEGIYQLKTVQDVPIMPLSKVLEEYNMNHIDFLDIDVEEHELEVLTSIDFNKVNVELILVEQLNMDLQGVIDSDIANYLKKYGYIPVSKFNRTVIYKRA